MLIASVLITVKFTVKISPDFPGRSGDTGAW